MRVEINENRMHCILVGGDQMAALQGRVQVDVKLNGKTAQKRQEGIIPVFDGWQSKDNFMSV